MRNGIPGLAVIAGAVGAGLALLASRTEIQQATPNPEPDLGEASVRYIIERQVGPGFSLRRDEVLKKYEEDYFHNAHWKPIPSLYCFGRDGTGGGNRMGDDLARIQNLAGQGFGFIESVEDGQEIINLMIKHTGDNLRLIRVIEFRQPV